MCDGCVGCVFCVFIQSVCEQKVCWCVCVCVCVCGVCVCVCVCVGSVCVCVCVEERERENIASHTNALRTVSLEEWLCVCVCVCVCVCDCDKYLAAVGAVGWLNMVFGRGDELRPKEEEEKFAGFWLDHWTLVGCWLWSPMVLLPAGWLTDCRVVGSRVGCKGQDSESVGL